MSGYISEIIVVPNFIDQATHDYLLKKIDQAEWCSDLKRRTQHYGYKYDYKKRNVTASTPIPKWLKKLCQEVRDLTSHKPTQVIINEYTAGQSISAHTDAPIFGEHIVSITLGGESSMIFERENQKVKIALRPCGAIMMSGDYRYKWKHCTSPIKSGARRVSITFRYLA